MRMRWQHAHIERFKSSNMEELGRCNMSIVLNAARNVQFVHFTMYVTRVHTRLTVTSVVPFVKLF